MTSKVDATINSSFNMYFCWFINLLLGVGSLSLIFAYLYLPYWFLTIDNRKHRMNPCLKVFLYILGILIVAPLFLVFEFCYFILTYVMGTLLKFQTQDFQSQRTAVSRMFTFSTQNTGYQRQQSDAASELFPVSELDDEYMFDSDDEYTSPESDELQRFL